MNRKVWKILLGIYFMTMPYFLLAVGHEQALQSDRARQADRDRQVKIVETELSLQTISLLFRLLGPFYDYYLGKFLNKIPVAFETGKWTWKKRPVFQDLVFSTPVQEKLEEYVSRVQFASQKKMELPNLLLYGSPGTGKTMFAKSFAKSGSFHYQFLSGASFLKYSEGNQVNMLTELLKWANSSSILDSHKVVIFIDEAELLLQSRKNSSDMSNRRLISEFLALTGSGSKNYSIIIATNLPQQLDPAIFRRFQYKVRVDIPKQDEVQKLIDLYSQKIHSKYPKVDDKIIQGESRSQVTDGLMGLSAAEIEEFLNELYFNGARNNNEISVGIIKKALENVKNKPSKEEDFLY